MCGPSIQAACNPPPQSLLLQIHLCHITALLCPPNLSQCLPCRSGAGTPQTIQGYPNTDPRLKLQRSELGQGDHPGLLLGWRWPVEEVSSCTGQFQQKPRNKRCCTELRTACCSATGEGRGCDHTNTTDTNSSGQIGCATSTGSHNRKSPHQFPLLPLFFRPVILLYILAAVLMLQMLFLR